MVKESKKNLLLVEDEAVIAMMEKRQLQKYGYNVITVLTGEKAIQSIDEGQLVDLILMDINLGTGMDGTETASMILRTRDIPVIFLSSHTEPEVVERTENISSYGYVVKSSSITVLDASIKMAFKLFEANTTIRQSDEKQRVMISNITDVLGIVDADGTIRYHSPNIERLFGWNSLELAGTKVWFAFHPEDLGGIRGEYAVLLGGHNSARSVECRYRCKDGSYKTVDLTVMNLIDDPIIHGFLLNFHDVSHRKSAEEALLASETRYRRLFEAAQARYII
ncbi:MAG TPA: PAS domain S-box protein [Rectinemataceae bacterium]|nr:PAS domain S-box protein [Rectinemataceae bacterium]